jgi:hypothetical protein
VLYSTFVLARMIQFGLFDALHFVGFVIWSVKACQSRVL